MGNFVWLAVLALTLSAMESVICDQECSCLIALTSESGYESTNMMYSVSFMDQRDECDEQNAERCSGRCTNGFLRSTKNGDLSQKSRQKSGVIGQHLCQALSRDVTSQEVGVFYRSCHDPAVLDSGVRAAHRICCADGLYSAC